MKEKDMIPRMIEKVFPLSGMEKSEKDPDGPVIPSCETCNQPFTHCACKHNDLKKSLGLLNNITK